MRGFCVSDCKLIEVNTQSEASFSCMEPKAN